MIIIAKNQTAGDLPLIQLSSVDAKIPASGQSTLSDYNTVYEILVDAELWGYIDSGDVILNVDGSDLTKAQAQVMLSEPPELKHNYSATENPTAGDDSTGGYSVGSVWINTSTNVVYICTDSSTGAANWSSSSGITASGHQVLRQLIHFIEDGPAEGFVSGAYKETTPNGPFPTSEIWWESSSKLKKILELTTSWTGPRITQEVWEVYDADGSTVLATVTDSISYSGPFETNRTRTIT